MASTLRAQGPRVAHVRPLQRHSVSYAFSVFPSVRPTTAALQRPRDERWRNFRACPYMAYCHYLSIGGNIHSACNIFNLVYNEYTGTLSTVGTGRHGTGG